jgi:hypothetical protein
MPGQQQHTPDHMQHASACHTSPQLVSPDVPAAEPVLPLVAPERLVVAGGAVCKVHGQLDACTKWDRAEASAGEFSLERQRAKTPKSPTTKLRTQGAHGHDNSGEAHMMTQRG